MKARPILFTAPMVHALLDGSKTQTRRILKGFALDWILTPVGFSSQFIADAENRLCPYGHSGDQLWVRESFRFSQGFDAYEPSKCTAANRIWYEADTEDTQPGAGKLRPSIFMPRVASRITLEVTGVRVERLQEISANDCQAEGIWSQEGPLTDSEWIDGYRILWSHINGPNSWSANPWVWVVEFKRVAP